MRRTAWVVAILLALPAVLKLPFIIGEIVKDPSLLFPLAVCGVGVVGFYAFMTWDGERRL